MNENAGMDMISTAEGLISHYVNMESNGRVMFIKLLIAKMKDNEVELVLRVIKLRQSVKNHESDDVSNFVDVGLKQEPLEHEENFYLEATNGWNTSDEMRNLKSCGEHFPNDEEGEQSENGEEKDVSNFLDIELKQEPIDIYFQSTSWENPSDEIEDQGMLHEGLIKPQNGNSKSSVSLTYTKEKKTFNCDQCDKSYGKKAYLVEHVETVHKGIRYPCEECDYRATKKCNLKKHILFKHRDFPTKKNHEKEYICDKCSQKFTNKNDLSKHLVDIHKGICFPCDKCDYVTTKKWHLQQHIDAIHRGIRYPCEHCSYEAKIKQTLQRHVETVHEGIRYRCELCDYTASRNTFLKKHIEVNHGGNSTFFVVTKDQYFPNSVEQGKKIFLAKK